MTKDEQNEKDFYEEDEIEDELDEDQIEENEAGMMEGFGRDEEKTFGDKKKKKK
ncbi:MAG TPA: hypothetical protein VJB90_04415 [Candidatus Nanoarchaeia archaeon]|nr:hypothetical protein [Candidatus Nanoarchaeia archaeon]